MDQHAWTSCIDFQDGGTRFDRADLAALMVLCGLSSFACDGWAGATTITDAVTTNAAFQVIGATDASASSTFLTVTTGGNTVSTPAKVDFTGEAYASTRVGWSGRTTWGERTVSASWVSASGYCIVLSPFGNLVHSVDRSDDDHGLEYFPSFDCDG